MNLAGRRVLVVGASAGIGRTVGVHAVRAGADVVFSARREEALQAAVTEAGGGRAVIGDIRRQDDCLRIAEQTANGLGGIDLVIVAAGMSPLRELCSTSMEDWEAVFATNVFGVSQVTAACLPHLSPGAVVAYLSSDSAHRPRYGLVPYAASKAALEAVVKGWRLEHPERRFVTIVVGPTVGTEFGDGFDPEAVAAAFPLWFAHGEIGTGMMDKDELADILLTSLGEALDRPSIDVQGMTLRPPGPLAPSVEEIIRIQAEQAGQSEGA